MKREFCWTSEGVREALGLPPQSTAARAYTGVSTDTRVLRPGELFVALRGERFDGADFVAAAAEAGAVGAVAERHPDRLPPDFELILVEDSLDALGRLAAARRLALDPTVVAITGTSGKTTTRALATAALGSGVYGSPGNFNNLVGVPLSILEAPAEAKIWVLELASNQRGEIERLARISNPDYAVITSVSEGHLEGLGDLQGVLDEKLSLLSSMRRDGIALVADEPPELVRRARDHFASVRTVGLSAEADERPETWSVSGNGVEWSWGGADFRLPGFGAHLLRDALFAIVLASMLGVDPRQAAQRLGSAEIPAMRGEVRRIGDLTLLVDCYNANPASFQAALDALTDLAAGCRRAVLAGTMLELGAWSTALHLQVARQMLDAGIELIAATGEFVTAFAQLESRAGEGLILEEKLEDAYRGLGAWLEGDEVVLLKASRGMKFERAIPWFERDFAAGGRVQGPGTKG
ncbi:MAG: UDP-N-acetylmuramoyl-tripeptide--D-alanyl-D-alanine ligase [Gemmatimonadota bacterium]|nr:MAG: UDP-N-acetylmuramoyl-tripeptide--D-alanyl-D-alanine ligase [Gemmatimonadota bacterium]